MYSQEQRSTVENDFRQPVEVVKNSQQTLCDFEGALARLGGDRRLLIELVHIYIEDAPMLLIRISNGVRDSNCADVLHARAPIARLGGQLRRTFGHGTRATA